MASRETAAALEVKAHIAIALNRIGEDLARQQAAGVPASPIAAGTVVCPTCQGELMWTVIDNSVHIECKTPNCLEWSSG